MLTSLQRNAGASMAGRQYTADGEPWQYTQTLSLQVDPAANPAHLFAAECWREHGRPTVLRVHLGASNANPTPLAGSTLRYTTSTAHLFTAKRWRQHSRPAVLQVQVEVIQVLKELSQI